MSTALLTDHYELTMLSAALKDGTAGRHCVFEVFARKLPPGRRYGVVAGTTRLVEAIAEFRFGPDELDFLRHTGVVDAPTADWLSEQSESLKATQKKLMDDTCEYVQANPLKAVGIAVVVGFLLSRIVL